jgi:hypothetical protein
MGAPAPRHAGVLPDDHMNRQRERDPELVPEHLPAVPGMLVVADVISVIRVGVVAMRRAQLRRLRVAGLCERCPVVMLVLFIIHAGSH